MTCCHTAGRTLKTNRPTAPPYRTTGVQERPPILPPFNPTIYHRANLALTLTNKKRSLMILLRLSILLVIVSVCSMLAAEDAADRAALQEARDLGRIHSRFLKASMPQSRTPARRIPKANLRSL